ncbi:protein kinase [Helicobacter sp. L8]|uniref:protein kinase n=1 Tax=Helicobacter sp. L8 TaxID=2316078 RepID=UPI000EAD5EFC|nr:protein kinase [Helicobacter sp. L8]
MKQKLDLLALIKSHDTLLIDESALVNGVFWKIYNDSLKEILHRTQKKIGVPEDVLERINEQRASDAHYQKAYKRYLSIQREVVSVPGTLTEIIKSKKNLLFTRNKALAQIATRSKQSTILFLSVSKKCFEFFNAQVKEDISKPRYHKPHISTGKLQLNSIPQEGEEAFYNHNGKQHSVSLIQVLSQGGEGIVYTTNTPMLAKIYGHKHKSVRTGGVPDYTPKKLALLVKAKVSKQVCMPTCLLKNQQGECVGYLMPKAEGKTLQHILGGSKDKATHIPNWGTKDLVRLCMSFLKTIQSLHDKGILVGDINPNNLMFTQNAEMFFIDCDSYQIDKYPCPVADPAYLVPEHLGKHMTEVMRSKSDEYFAVACLLFVILTLGVHPYNHKGLGRDEAMKQGAFAYPLNGGDLSLVPQGRARDSWVRLSPQLQECFYGSFQKGGKFYSAKKRLSPPKWLDVLNKFYQQL